MSNGRRGSLLGVLVVSLLCSGALTISALVGIAAPVSAAGAADTFHITTTSLPAATPGEAYAKVTLQVAGVGVSATGYTTTLRWGRVSLPRGFKLTKAGVLYGLPSKRLLAGASSVVVKVTEKVTSLETTHKGEKPVRKRTTAEATIPITIE